MLRRFRERREQRLIDKDLSSLIGRDETALLNYLREKNANRQSFGKIFCIGYNKTGTTSLEAVLKGLGFRMPDQAFQERLASHVLVSGKYDVLRGLVEHYDAFQDLPFSQENAYVALDAMFPDSKFILTIRDPDSWFESLLEFHKNVFGFDNVDDLSPDYWHGAKYLHNNYVFEQHRRHVTKVNNGHVFENWADLYDRDFMISSFISRNNEIIRYFRDRPSDFLCLDVSQETDTSKVCSFLHVDKDNITEFPRLNARY
ncbi:sulfotransferase [Methyloceanibacter sp. wino2]|uniref:sulfotransferase n=1 Tax=Methyloceanibacter sp. wino2 TaxID=2170729 RepID=UPI00131F046E|nr:sulfotransferase [Methyloceanibacter sp. wino2]